NWRIDSNALTSESKRWFISCWLNNNDERQIEFFCEFQITFVVCGHATNRPRTITNQHIVSDPDWYLCAGFGIDLVRAGEDTGFVFGQIGAFEIAFACGPFAILAHRG